MTYRAIFLDDFVPKEDKPYETVIRGKPFTGMIKGDVDHCKDIRAALQELWFSNLMTLGDAICLF